MKTTLAPQPKACPPRRIPPAARMTSRELQKAHDTLAAEYDRRTWFNEHVLGVARLRKTLLSQATGRILEVACGTGINFRHYPPHGEITAVDLSPQMLDVAREKAGLLERATQTLVREAVHHGALTALTSITALTALIALTAPRGPAGRSADDRPACSDPG